jgi:hypothetical protein
MSQPEFKPGDKVVGRYAPNVGEVVAVETSTVWGETQTTVTVRWHPAATWTGLAVAEYLRLATDDDEVAAERAWHDLMVRFEALKDSV